MAVLDPAVWFWLPLALMPFAMGAAIVAKERVSLGFWSTSAVGLIVLSFSATAGWSWLLRDGLGPSAVPSAGLKAVERFSAAMGVPLAIQGAMVAGISGVWRRRAQALRRTEGAK